GTRLAPGSYAGPLAVWEVPTGRRLQTLPGHADAASGLAFSADGQTLAVGRPDGSVRLWDAATGAEQDPIRGHDGHVIAVAYSPDGRFLASAGMGDRTVNLYDAATRQRLHTFRVADR